MVIREPDVSVVPYPTEGFTVVTKEMAITWLSNFNYHHQRKIRPYHVALLAREMESGRFREKTQINFCRYRGGYYLTNGQHTLAAIQRSGIEQNLSVIVTDKSSMEEIADDFSRHDTHLTRTHADSLVAHETHEKLGVTVSEMKWVSGACMFYAYGLEQISVKSQNQISHDEKLDLVMMHGKLAASAIRLIPTGYVKSRSTRWATRKTTLASIMFALDNVPDLAEEFWPAVITDDGLRIGDPRKTLNKFLSESAAGGNAQGPSANLNRISHHDLVKGIAACWNAFVKHRELRLIRIKHEDRFAEFMKCGVFRL